jgi:1-acyl-sn-glycerol-3-phosphate acyltransferase
VRALGLVAWTFAFLRPAGGCSTSRSRRAAGFIAKAEVGTWPGIGLIARLGRTDFVDRRPRSSRTQRDAVTARLTAGESLILFAEGTSSDGRKVLSFKSTLFGALQAEAATVAMVPVTIAYERFRGGFSASAITSGRSMAGTGR